MATPLKTGDLPELVKHWVSHVHPQADILASSQRSDGTLEVEIDQAEGSLLLRFAADGTWLHSRKGVAMRRLPARIVSYLQGKQREYADMYAEQVFSPEGHTHYEVFLEPRHDKSLVRIRFAEEGRLLDVEIVPR